MSANNYIEGSSNYEHTVSRIVNEGFRFSKEVSPQIYKFYRDWIESKKNKTETDKEYLKLFSTLPYKGSK